MPRAVVLTGLLLAIVSGVAWGDIYKCTRADGSVLFVDNPAHALGDCEVERVGELPVLNTLPAAPSQQVTAPIENPQVPVATAVSTGKSFETFKGEAAQLVDAFTAARRSVYRASYAAETLQARRELTDVRAKKSALLSELAQSTLSDAEKGEIQGVLSGITE